MNPSQSIGLIAFGLVRMLLSGSTLKWSTVNDWVTTNGNSDNYGRGYAGGSLPRGTSNGYVEVRRGQSSNGKIEVTASVYFDARQGAAFTKSWTADKLDSKLQQRFGDNLRIRIKV